MNFEKKIQDLKTNLSTISMYKIIIIIAKGTVSNAVGKTPKLIPLDCQLPAQKTSCI